MLAAEKGSHNLIRMLLASKADLKLRDRFGKTALFYAIDMNHENTEAVAILIDAGADVNQEANDRATPLMKAVERGHYNIVKLLLNRGANVHSHYESTGMPYWLNILKLQEIRLYI